MKQSILIKKTSKVILIYSYLIARILRMDAKQEVSCLDVNISNLNLGKEIKKKLSESHIITEDMFMNIWNR